MLPMRRLCCLLLLLCIFIGTLNSVRASTGSFIVEAGKELPYKIDVSSGDRVQLNFITTGDPNSNFCFSLTFPNSTILDLGEIDKYSTSFTADTSGTCELLFNNTSSSQPSFVALNYEVEHYILGIPQMIFLLIVIVVLAVIIMTGYVIMGKSSY
jgi:hypothetical protein